MSEETKHSGRPRAQLDWTEIGEMLQAGCTGVEIAAHLGYCPKTLYDNCPHDNNMTFDEFARKKKKSGKALLKQKQFNTALSGDKSLLIWLGKQRLGQSEKKLLHIKKFSQLDDLQKIDALMQAAERKQISADDLAQALNAIKCAVDIKHAKEALDKLDKIEKSLK